MAVKKTYSLKKDEVVARKSSELLVGRSRKGKQ
jgi:hypothetical protein